MKICPRCREEYLDSIEICKPCDSMLMTEEEALGQPENPTAISKEALLEQDTVPFLEGALGQCREVEKILYHAQIPCLVYPKDLGCQDHKTIGTTCSMQYYLLVKESDIPRSKKALEQRFMDQVAKEGQGAYVHDVVDSAAEHIVCPACGEKGALENDECQSCGLFLGGERI